MKQAIITQIQALRIIIQQLRTIEPTHLNLEQSEDITHILNALDSMEQFTLILDNINKTDEERMQILHDLTTPINGIIGYLYILEQGYSGEPLTTKQNQIVQSISLKVNSLYQYISNQLLSPQTGL